MNTEDLSPISCFNNIQYQIYKNIFLILYPEFDGNLSSIMSKGQILFLDNSIIILNLFKLEVHKGNDVRLKVLQPLNQSQLKLLHNIYLNWESLVSNFGQYLVMYNKIANGFDDVPFILVDFIIRAIKEKNQEKLNNYFLVPYKNKIKALYDVNGLSNDDNKSIRNICKNILERYEYLIKFNIKSNQKFSYMLCRCLSSELDESKSIENIRFEDIDIIKKDSYLIRNCDEFVKQLFYYGEIL